MSGDDVFSVRSFKDLVSDEAWAELTAYPSWPYAPDRTLLHQGDPGTHVLALTDGLVKVVREDRDGRERLLAFRGPGEILGEMAIQERGVRLAAVRTMSKCTASVIPADSFRRFVRGHQLAQPLAVLASSRLREQTEIHDGAVHQRLAVALIRLVEVSGTDSLTLTREELAQHIGVGRKAVSKALDCLGPGLVKAGKRRICGINVGGLKGMLERSMHH
ncbi:Crp/Fnr family transcriptional regulator [Streptomyces sp. VNUA116]|uniref:Crp/Fnr family transcriptional regulator n=1 Tax=Streptomyces sp. VNUA116 TaxID=3062449 RepID=UPI0026753259|nr:Crp/Fnr family transcriptional regulator [Streptomyces sp. VNUA116]WKU43875.1 Crp/Fnr family transcriptional regulator [Streptomyces sp. VNUA116]